jgi:tRNA pseudouridine38-40 synthase
MINLKATLAFHGGAYVGWQCQATGISVQQRLEEVLERLGGRRIVTRGASRTDRGVHALGMPVTFRWPAHRIGRAALLRGLNALLPEDIRVLRLQKVSGDFDARFSARWKWYRYRILNRPVADPFRRDFTWFIYGPLDLRAMRRAARHFPGKHHFGAFAANPGYERQSMVRTIRRCTVIRRKDEIHVEVEGNAFLYKMVRTIVGTLVEVGAGKRDPSSIPDLLRSRDRRLAGKTAPPQGLYLMKVVYSMR